MRPLRARRNGKAEEEREDEEEELYTHARPTLEKLALFRSRPGAIKCAACVEGHRYKNSQHRALSLGARGKTAAEKLLQTRGVETREKSRGVIPYVGRNFRRYFHFSTPTLISPGFVATTPPCEEASPTSLFFFFFFPPLKPSAQVGQKVERNQRQFQSLHLGLINLEQFATTFEMSQRR